MRFWIFLALLVSTIVVVWRFGDWEQKGAVSILATAFISTGIFYNLDSDDWLDPQASILLLDTLVFFALAFIAVRSKRYWPLLIVALHGTTLVIFVARMLPFLDINSYGVGMSQALWAYPQLIILFWAALRTRKRNLLENKMSSFSPS